jgi:group I intron endonuclease
MLAFANDLSTLNCTFMDIFEIIPIYSSDISLLSSIVPIKVYSNADTMKQDIIRENNKKIGIYRWINNENNYTYIGSSINLSNRLRLYYNYDFISEKSNNKSMIHDALVKYGYSKFTLEILEYCDASSVLEREQYYLDTLNPKYNILKIAGSLTGFKHSDESILKRVSTFTDNQKIKKALKAIEPNEGLIEDKPLINFPLKGSSRPIEVVEKMRKNHSRSKIVYEYKADKVTLIAKYDSLRQAQEVSGLSREYIARCIKTGKLAHNSSWYSFSELKS